MNVNNQLQQAIDALKAGRKDEARQMLGVLLKADRNHEKAWQWMYNAAENDKERVYCLQQVLRINPGNEKARLALQSFSSQAVPAVSTLPAAPETKKTINYWTTLPATLAIVCICIFAFSMMPGNESKAQKYQKEFGGNLQTYESLLASNDCVWLQNEFNTASGNNYMAAPNSEAKQYTVGYMKAADERMKEIGCYAAAQPTAAPNYNQPQTSNCNPAYPDVCITQDVSCDTLRQQGISNFKVLSPDPFGYDRDLDGTGCEN